MTTSIPTTSSAVPTANPAAGLADAAAGVAGCTGEAISADFAQLLAAPVSPDGMPEPLSPTAPANPLTAGRPATLARWPGWQAGATPIPLVARDAGTAEVAAPSRDQAEAAAAMAATLWPMQAAPLPTPSLPETEVTTGTNPDARPTRCEGEQAASTATAPMFKIEDAAAVDAFALPELPAETVPMPAAETASEAVEVATGQAAVAVVQPERPLARPPVFLRPEVQPSAYAEKTAALPAAVENTRQSQNIISEKNFLSVDGKLDGAGERKAGIRVAQGADIMPTSAKIQPHAVEATTPAFSVDARIESAAGAQDRIPVADPKAVLAGRAVAAVNEVVEAQAAMKLEGVASVQLRLKVGAENVAIRVEMRDGNVHTHFRTESAELSRAISTEWNALRAEPAERNWRYLEPEYTAPKTDAFSGNAGGFAQQNHSSRQQVPSMVPFSFAAAKSGAAAAAESSSAPGVIPMPTSLHLSAVA